MNHFKVRRFVFCFSIPVSNTRLQDSNRIKTGNVPSSRPCVAWLHNFCPNYLHQSIKAEKEKQKNAKITANNAQGPTKISNNIVQHLLWSQNWAEEELRQKEECFVLQVVLSVMCLLDENQIIFVRMQMHPHMKLCSRNGCISHRINYTWALLWKAQQICL